MPFSVQPLIRVAALCALLACADALPSAPSAALRAPEDSRVSAKGKVEEAHAIHVRISNMVLGTTIVDEYSFHMMEVNDDAKGKFFLYQRRIIDGEEVAVVIASGPAVCVEVDGNKAKVGGRVTFTTFPEGIPMGSELTWSVTDNGKSAHAEDLASQPLGNNARAYCELGLPYAETPIERGKIQVKE